MTSLPTHAELVEAANSDDDAECSEMVMRVIAFGTAAHEALPDRKDEACKLLAEAWKDCVALEDCLVDALWLRGCILSFSGDTATEQEQASVDALVDIVKSLVQVPDRNSFYTKLQCNLLPFYIDAAGLASEQDILKRLKMHNTNFNYKQQKYNLLQEESEGYAKVLRFLTSSDDKEFDVRWKHLQELVGTFELDPNRVMDLTIDVLESKLYPEEMHAAGTHDKIPEKSNSVMWLLELMKEFSLEELPSLINFKVKERHTPAFLGTVAMLVREGLLDFSKLINRFFPSLEKDINEAHKVLWMKEKRRVQALSRISLSGAPKEDPKVAELQERLQKQLMTLKTTPPVSILLILMQWGQWDTSRVLLSLESWTYLCDLFPTTFGFALCDVASNILEPWYKSRVANPGLLKPWGSKIDVEMEEKDELTVAEVVAGVSGPLLLTLNSGCISERPILYCQLCRLFCAILEQSEDEIQIDQDVYSFFARFMVPCLSLFPSNPALSMELWSVLKKLPYPTRYRLYVDWKGSGLEKEGLSTVRNAGKPLPVVECEMQAGKAARYSLKRLSKDNIRDMSRQLAKVTHSCPLVIYDTILKQMESYDNMIEVMVEAQRFSNALGLDVLGFCILSRLSGTSGGVNRSRLKEDGVNVSQWLQSLESFAGAFFKRYPFVELRGILAYLMRRLREGNVMELGILRTLLKVPGGYGFADYSPAASLSGVQLEGRAGSLTLKRETMSFGIAEDINQHAADRIKQVLTTDAAGPSILMLVAQARSRIIFEATEGKRKPVKLVGNLYDSSQVLMSILLDFLTDESGKGRDESSKTSPIEDYAKELPTLGDLHSKFGLDMETAWMLCRPVVKAAAGHVSGKIPAEMRVYSVGASFRKSYKNMLSEEAWANLTQPLYETFFMHSLSDILCPESVYNGEISRINKEIERLDRAKGGPPQPNQSGKDDAANLVRLKSISKTLEADCSDQKEQVRNVLSKLQKSKEKFFDTSLSLEQAAKSFFLYCVYGRSLQSPDDAMYSARFAFQMHEMDTPGFSTLHYIDELISVASGCLFGLTEGEAANLAILLWETWTIVNKWRYEDGLFEKAVKGKAGSFMELSEDGSKEVTHKDYISLYNTWHASLGTALIGCLKSNEYMHMRSGLLVLTRIVEVFPTRPTLGNALFSALKPLQDEKKARPDIRASANAYATMLLKARDDGKWIEEDAAVAKARADKEKQAAEERKKKLEKQFREMQRDSEKITEEIGPRDRFERRRDGRDFSRDAAPGTADRGRGGHSPMPNRETGEVSARASRERERSDRRSPDRRRDRGDDRGRGEPPGTGGRNSDRHSSDRPPERGRRENGERGSRNDDGDRGLGGRWVRGAPVPPADSGRGGKGSKRSRGPSPERVSEERGNVKRPRLEGDNYESRRDAGRASSPPRRGRGNPEPSRSSRSRRSRR